METNEGWMTVRFMQSKETAKSVAVVGGAIATGLAAALVLTSAPVLGGRDSALAAAPRCSGGEGTASPTPAESDPGPIPTLPLPTGSQSPSPTGSPSPTSSSEIPAPAMTTPESTPTPGETPVTSPPDSTTKCQTRITLRYRANKQRFSGEVRSGKAVCERGRRVLLKRDRKKGRDRTVATTVSRRRGKYRIPLPDRNGRRFYTKAPRQVVTTASGQEIVCMADRSRSVSTRNPL